MLRYVNRTTPQGHGWVVGRWILRSVDQLGHLFSELIHLHQESPHISKLASRKVFASRFVHDPLQKKFSSISGGAVGTSYSPCMCRVRYLTCFLRRASGGVESVKILIFDRKSVLLHLLWLCSLGGIWCSDQPHADYKHCCVHLLGRSCNMSHIEAFSHRAGEQPARHPPQHCHQPPWREL